MAQQLPEYVEFLLNGWQHNRNFGVVRTTMDSGFAKQRSRFKKGIVTRDVSFIVSDEDRKLFDTWMEVNLSGGVDLFTFKDPVDNTTKQGRIVNGEVTWQPAGSCKLWEATLQIESVG